MADIKAFKALRPVKDMIEKSAALPYDVYDRAEAVEEVKKNPDSFLAIDRAETAFGPEVDTYADVVYAKAAALMQERIDEGVYKTDEKACYYIYEQTMEGRVQTGIVACASIDDYENGIIKKHENTRADKEEDRVRHVDALSAQTGPIFLAYRENSEIRRIIEKVKADKNALLYDFVSTGDIRNRCFIIADDEDIKTIKEAFEGIDHIYIADGHHRCASAVRVGKMRRAAKPGYNGTEEFNHFLAVLFPDEELKIMDYNRVVKDLNGMTADGFMEAIGRGFVISAASASEVHPGAKGEIGMYLDHKWYLLTMKNEIKSTDPVDGLDVAVLQNEVLDKLLGIKDPKTDKRIDFVGGIRGLKELERRVDALGDGVAFAMYPTQIGELFAVADAGRLMPPKSTWFEPKLLSGIFIHQFER
ncbi:MAG: DUF1015 domain-containing protein [Lachnospiraceae bacterium]|nr:DUF1015 domain-containing protein [Lachnospiraceae bacterium]